MPRISLDGYKDPTRRPRYIIWTGVAVLGLAAFVIVALGVVSTRWFCAEACHAVQDDTITAYERSTHSEVGCMACHMTVGADPITFVLHKAESLGELYLTVTGNFELPLNAASEVALTMDSAQCTQCHDLKKRPVTPARGIIINHDVHAEAGFGCGVCHNRVAHNENFELVLKDPKTGEPNRKHEQFMSMTACFRCHKQDGSAEAPGTCGACHTKDFRLKPPSHLEKSFYPGGHANLAREEATRVASAASSQGESGEASAEKTEPGEALDLPTVSSINQCSTCHAEKFCTDCHGVPMPHPADFKKGHGTFGKKNPGSCSKCHGDAKVFCDECHHGTAMNIQYFPDAGPWQRQHPAAVRALGASACFDCHDPTYCAHCHVSGSPK